MRLNGKNTFSIMKSVEFGFSSATDESSVDDPATPKTSSSATPDLISGSVVTKQSLELLLLEKNKKLQNDATNLRNSNTALQGTVEVNVFMLQRACLVLYVCFACFVCILYPLNFMFSPLYWKSFFVQFTLMLLASMIH